MLPARMVFVGFDNFVQKLNLIESGLGVMSSGAHNLESNVLARGVISRQPDGGKMAPAELSNDGVLAVLVLLANLDGMVAAFAVVLRVLFVGRVVGFVD